MKNIMIKIDEDSLDKLIVESLRQSYMDVLNGRNYYDDPEKYANGLLAVLEQYTFIEDHKEWLKGVSENV